MRIRIGFGLSPLDPADDFATMVERVEEAGIDSLWFSEQTQSAQAEPTIGLAYAAARTTRLKVGTSVIVLPDWHPALVAKQIARWPGWRHAASSGLRVAAGPPRRPGPVPRAGARGAATTRR